jgi:hypothetical protein
MDTLNKGDDDDDYDNNSRARARVCVCACYCKLSYQAFKVHALCDFLTVSCLSVQHCITVYYKKHGYREKS